MILRSADSASGCRSNIVLQFANTVFRLKIVLRSNIRLRSANIVVQSNIILQFNIVL